jgi:hypothetical protein
VVALAQWLAKRAPDRDSVKIAIAILGLVPNDESTRILEVLGRHEEFTLYSVVAIANTMEFPDRVLWRLAKDVTGWGRIHSVTRLRETTDAEIKHWLLRRGYQNDIEDEYTALICAEAGGLLQALRATEPDPELIHGASEIIGAMITSQGGPAPGIEEYADGP